MIADIILLILALIALIFATVIDIKIKEVPNWITYSLIISALAIRLISSLVTNQYYYILNALIVLLIVSAIAQLLYRLQIWGGGDSKLLIALTTVFATKPYFLEFNYPFLLVLVTSILFCGAVYAIAYAIYLIITNMKKFIQEFKKINKLKAIKLIKILSLFLSIFIFILLLLSKYYLQRIALLMMLIIIFFYVYIWISIKAIENISMYKKIPTAKLVEGDWVTQNIIKNNKIIYKKHKTGIRKQEIENLKQHNITHVTIKTGIPFVPPFLAGLILTIIIGLL